MYKKVAKSKKKKKPIKKSIDCYGIKVTDRVGKISILHPSEMLELGDMGKW